MALEVKVRAIPCGEPTVGEFCRHCLLPSVVEHIMLVELDDSPLGAERIAYCTECERVHRR